jgi:hypothetical protein
MRVPVREQSRTSGKESSMHSNDVLAHDPVQSATCMAMIALVCLASSACAIESRRESNAEFPRDKPYVGLFTGEYVDGKPLYRFPSINVVGSRSTVDGS